MSVDADLLVAGGGPVGLVTALAARDAGMTVVVAEPREGPVDKACGEGLMPSGLALLRALGVDPPGRDFRGIAYRDLRGHHVRADLPSGPGRGVRRTRLHEVLSTAAADAGVRFVRLAVRDVQQDADGVSAGGVRARWLVAADGLHSPLRRALGLQLPPTRRPRHGLRAHVTTAPWSDDVEVWWSPRAELYVTPVDHTTVGLAVLTAERGLSFEAALGLFPPVARRVAGAASASRVRGAGPLQQRTSARVRGRVLLVGDAAGYVDALTGEGLAVGFREAAAAVRALVRDDPRSYEREWRRIGRTPRTLTTGLVRATSVAPLRRALVPAAVTVPFVFRAVVGRLA